jgi:hypothetical protein
LRGEEEDSSLLCRVEKVAAIFWDDTVLVLPPPDEIFGRGWGGFLPGRVRGLIPGDLRERPAHLRSGFRRLTVSVDRGSISTDFSHRKSVTSCGI